MVFCKTGYYRADFNGNHKFWIGTESRTDHNVQINTNVGQILQFRSDRIIQNKTIFTPDVNITSDKRLKKNINQLENCLSKIQKLNGYSYQLFDKDNKFIHNQYGLVAQEVQKEFPNSVIEGIDGYLTISYNSIIPILLEQIKELKSEVDRLKKKKLFGIF